MRKVARFALLFLIGLAILAVPDAYEGPLLLRLSEGHVIRLVDALGLAIIILATPFFLKALRERL